MAESKTSNVYRPARYRSLSTITLGGQAIRFLGVNEGNQGVHFPKTPINCLGQLLFLATDVLAATQIGRKNHIRVHGRFAKSGLASKVRLTGFKIENINNSNIMWFYSIKGLFRVAFEIGSEDLQRDCLSILQSEWLRRCNEPLLKPEFMIRLNLRLKMDTMQNWDNNLVVERHTIDDSDDESSLGNISETHIKLEDNDWNDDLNGNHNNEEESMSGLGFLEKLNNFLIRCKAKGDEQAQKIIAQISVAGDYLNNVLVNIETFQASEFALFEMMTEYLFLMNAEVSDIYAKNTFGLNREKYTLLYVISDWVGNEFNQLEPRISEKVEIFKESNIHQIDNLPPSEETIDSLFPQCMKKLITNWLGKEVDLQAENLPTHSVTSDHDYCPDSKRKKSDRERTKYPLVQLVLEFVTNSLISGVSHVVYSRLRADGQI